MDIERLRDVEYYMRTGLKRKKGYLFYGPPGCGKTSTVVAMALLDNRHIIEIPMCRVKTNKELEDIFAMNEINKVKIDKNKVILLFDEIDTGMENVSKPTKNPMKVIKKQLKKMTSISSSNASSNAGSTNDSEDEGEEDEIVDFGVKIKDEEDKINIGTILSRLDGIGNYNGLIIVGTTNSITKLTPALYREGRLTPLYF
jgi:chaperone BCS1